MQYTTATFEICQEDNRANFQVHQKTFRDLPGAMCLCHHAHMLQTIRQEAGDENITVRAYHAYPART
jgi:hypothetical protein